MNETTNSLETILNLPWKRVTSGRCKPCGLVYQWPTGASRKLRFAWCPRCGRKLRGTAVSLMTAPVMAPERPYFGIYQPRGGGR